MNRIHTIIITFTLLFVSFNSTASEKNPTDAELKTYLFSQSSNFETLISIVNNTQYTGVIWVKNGPLNARSSINKDAVWNKSPKLDKFVNQAIAFGFERLLIYVDDLKNWNISTGQEVIFLDGDLSKATAKVKTVKKSFWYGDKPEYSICTSELVEKSLEGECYIPLLTNWFLFKYWFTYDLAVEQN